MTAPTGFRCGTASPSTARLCQLVGLGLGTLVLLPGCPLSDNFSIKESSSASGASNGTSSASEAGGTSKAAQVIGSTNKPSTDLATGGSSSPLQPWSEGGTSNVGGNVAASGGGSGGATTESDAATTESGDAVGGAGTVSGGAPDAEAGGPNADPSAGGLRGASGSRGVGGGTAGRNGAPGISGATSNGGASGASNSVTCPDALAKGPRGCKGADLQLCYRSCGPANLGTQSLTCVGNEYVESTCTYPIGQNYGCYRIPLNIPVACPAGPPQEGAACSVAPCTVCFGGNPASPSYLDATNARKGGYCVCVQPGQWSCASAASWPCPSLINGC